MLRAPKYQVHVFSVRRNYLLLLFTVVVVVGISHGPSNEHFVHTTCCSSFRVNDHWQDTTHDGTIERGTVTVNVRYGHLMHIRLWSLFCTRTYSMDALFMYCGYSFLAF